MKAKISCVVDYQEGKEPIGVLLDMTIEEDDIDPLFRRIGEVFAEKLKEKLKELKYDELKDMLEENQPNYKKEAWKNYSDEELKWWVKLLRKRAGHRTNKEKKDKDLKDASNYELMLSGSEHD